MTKTVDLTTTLCEASSLWCKELGIEIGQWYIHKPIYEVPQDTHNAYYIRQFSFPMHMIAASIPAFTINITCGYMSHNDQRLAIIDLALMDKDVPKK